MITQESYSRYSSMNYQLSPKQIFNKFAWYPPAETKLPLSAFINAILTENDNFEQSLSDYLGISGCVLGNSARALLYLLLESLKKKSGYSRNEVLIPGFTCYSVAASVAKAGLKIRTYDVYSRSLQPDIESLRKVASDRTLAIISQHLFGIPSPLQEINKISKSVEAYHIEDAAQALGSKINGFYVGTIGDFGLYSFGRGKALPVGCGGAVVGKDRELIKKLMPEKQKMGYLQFLKSLLIQIISMPTFYGLAEILPLGLGKTVFNTAFDISTMPYFVNRMAKRAISELESLNKHRRQIAELYKEGFSAYILIPVPKNVKPVYTRFPLMAGKGPINHDLKRLGVRRMYPKAIPKEITILPYLAEKNDPGSGSAKIARELITLPTHKGINSRLAKYIVEVVKKKYKF